MSAFSTRLQLAGFCALALASLGLGRIVYGELGHGSADIAPGRSAPASVAPTRGGDKPAGYALPPLERFSAIIKRPLFSPSRRPPPREPEHLEQLDSFVLEGVLISPASRTAVVEHGRPPVTAHVVEGQDIEGWTVSSILPDRIVLRHGVTQHELKLRDQIVQPPPGIRSQSRR